MAATDTPLLIEIIDPLVDPADDDTVVVGVVGGRRPARRTPPGSAANRRPSRIARTGGEIVQRLGRRRAQRDHDGSPRRDSRVRRHVFAPFPDVRAGLPAEASVVAAGSGRLVVTTPFEPVVGGGVRARAVLRLRASWPALPMWITVEPWWRSRTVATIELRSHRRVRYPRRYFDVAHSALGEIGRRVPAT